MKFRYAAWGVLLIALILGGFLLIGTNSDSYQKCLLEKSPSEKSYSKNTFFTCEARFADENNALIVAFSTVIVASFTVSLVFATIALFESSERSTKIAERALTDIQRALVVPTRFQSDTLVRNDQIIGYQLTAILENTGNTVARRFTGTANVVLWDGSLPEDFKYPDRQEIGPGRAFVGPHVVTPYPIGVAIQDILDIMNKKKKGFYYGWVEYSDIFTHPKLRRTEYCVEIEVIGDPTILRKVGKWTIFGFGSYGRYNGTDEDCFYRPGERPPVGGLPPPTQPPEVSDAGLSQRLPEST
jgi:hypothetical protein